ncbi:hypothetical protein PtA15_15A103 [Puccinia triticina]|uniref:Uncharacterized protein n=1 Tax=Puccinia triticina TaxID=208348 RepID=A0ABY7D614_9BASI|nr:uncharacterized protein PtA15_15A103 [Puccinia triticina]WAQ91712.1 hypothetical protein PtA15_15A103 [Puccinia triticina]
MDWPLLTSDSEKHSNQRMLCKELPQQNSLPIGCQNKETNNQSFKPPILVNEQLSVVGSRAGGALLVPQLPTSTGLYGTLIAGVLMASVSYSPL